METGAMKTDVKEVDGNIELEMDLPGCQKEEIQAELKDGYLTVYVKKEEVTEEADVKYIKRERFTGSCKRSFFVGKELEQEDINASFDNGVLKLVYPKDKKKEEAEEDRFIKIF